MAFFVALSAMLITQSCDEDDPINTTIPTITLSATTGQANPGETVSVTATITAPGGAKELLIAGGATPTPASPIALTGTSATQQVTLQVPASAVLLSTISVIFTVVDNGGLVSLPVSYTITVQDPIIVLSGTLTTQSLVASRKYLIRGQTFVPDGVTITIPAGTVIFGEKATKGTMIVERGGKILANGTAALPVVMTSNQEVGARDKGDWGGLVILGKAFTNQPNPGVEGISPPKNFGAADRANDTDNSGVYKYLRVEYAGIELTPNNETNSITMGGLGSGTVMEYVQVSYGGDDGYEYFGGTVNGKWLISFATWDDDFDCDFGWSGNVQFALVVRNPNAADQSQSNAFEHDNGPQDNDTGAGTYTTGTFSNVTVYGPIDLGRRTVSANNVHAMDLRRRNASSIFNSVMGGFPFGLRYNQTSSYDQHVTAVNGVLANNYLIAGGSGFATPTFANPAGSTTSYTRFAVGSGMAATAANVQTYWETVANANAVANIPAQGTDDGAAFYDALGLRGANFFARYTNATYPVDPDFTLTSGTPTLSTGASFANAKFDEAGRSTFFNETVTYRGAFGATDWTNTWAEFRPISKVY